MIEKENIKIGINATSFDVDILMLPNTTRSCLYVDGEGNQREGYVYANDKGINIGPHYRTTVRLITNDPKSYFIKPIKRIDNIK